MTAKQRRLQREQQIAFNAWYSCMIAMGSIPKDENLYAKARQRFLKKFRIRENQQIPLTCEKEFGDIRDAYLTTAYKR